MFLQLLISYCCVLAQSKYKEASKKDLGSSLYSVLSETKDTQHAREQTQLHSEVPLPTMAAPPSFLWCSWSSCSSVCVQGPRRQGSAEGTLVLVRGCTAVHTRGVCCVAEGVQGGGQEGGGQQPVRPDAPNHPHGVLQRAEPDAERRESHSRLDRAVYTDIYTYIYLYLIYIYIPIFIYI